MAALYDFTQKNKKTIKKNIFSSGPVHVKYTRGTDALNRTLKLQSEVQNIVVVDYARALEHFLSEKLSKLALKT